MTGYNGYSMSNGAIDAYDEGLLPVSKMVIFLKRKYPKQFKGVTTKDISQNAEASEWHHTSKYYNETKFYSLKDIYEARVQIKTSIKRRLLCKKLIKQAKEMGIVNIIHFDNYTNSYKIWYRINIKDIDYNRLKETIESASNNEEALKVAKSQIYQ